MLYLNVDVHVLVVYLHVSTLKVPPVPVVDPVTFCRYMSSTCRF